MTFDLRIDGDGIVYRAGFAADSRSDELSHSLYNAKLIINSIIDKFQPCTVKVFLTDKDPKTNFRSTIVDDYKANRKGSPKPKYYKELREYLIEKYDAIVCQWGEADDWLGIDYTTETVIASNDKDLLMIPCYHYRISRDELIKARDPGTLYLEKNNKNILGTGFKWFCAQMVMGDKVDNIHKPAKGFGPVAVFNMFNGVNDRDRMWKIVYNHYKSNGKTEDEMYINAKLLWISRSKEQIFNEKVLKELL